MATNDLRGFWKQPTPARQKVVKARKQKKKLSRIEKRKRIAAQKLTAAGVTPIGKPHPDYRNTDPGAFYKSREWRTLRYLALKNCDGCCQCCGARAEQGSPLHVDHIIPRYKAPHLSLDLDNLQVLCDDCNIGKGAWDDTNWRDHMKSI